MAAYQKTDHLGFTLSSYCQFLNFAKKAYFSLYMYGTVWLFWLQITWWWLDDQFVCFVSESSFVIRSHKRCVKTLKMIRAI